jgi:hypothetical protein
MLSLMRDILVYSEEKGNSEKKGKRSASHYFDQLSDGERNSSQKVSFSPHLYFLLEE